MARKRMVSLQIVDTDAFLDMPQSTQLLYFHFVVRADDEGFLGSPKRIMKLIGVQDDDLKILIAKRFILSFESGIVVIKHWLIHNNIRMDRFNKTNYSEEKKLLTLKENKSYTENGNQMVTSGCPKLSESKSSKVKLSKIKKRKPLRGVATSSHKIEEKKEPKKTSKQEIEILSPEEMIKKIMDSNIKELMTVFYENDKCFSGGAFFGRKVFRDDSKFLIEQYGLEETIIRAEKAVSLLGVNFAPQITNPSELRYKMIKMESFLVREQSKPGGMVMGTDFSKEE